MDAMKKTLKVGLIGLGGICRSSHMPGFDLIKDLEIAAICDIKPEKIASFKEKFDLPDVPAFTDYHDLLAVEGLDFVDICTPNKMHSIIAVDALERGLHVFCEKPDAISVSEIERMKAAAEKADRHLMVMRNNRYRKSTQYLKQLITEGKMGDIYCGRCGWIRRRGIPGKGGWFTTKELSGGGPLIDLGVHMIDLAIWLMGNPTPVAVSGCTYCKFADSDASDSVHAAFGEKAADGRFDVEDLAMGFIRFDNGACLQIEFSWASNVEQEKMFVELRGTKAGTSFCDNMETETTKVFTETDGVLEDVLPKIGETRLIHGRNLKHFTDVLRGEAEPDYVPQQGVDMIKILDAIYRSAECGHEIRL